METFVTALSVPGSFQGRKGVGTSGMRVHRLTMAQILTNFPTLSYKGLHAARRRIRRGLCDRRRSICRRLRFCRLPSLRARDRGFDGLL